MYLGLFLVPSYSFWYADLGFKNSLKVVLKIMCNNKTHFRKLLLLYTSGS